MVNDLRIKGSTRPARGVRFIFKLGGILGCEEYAVSAGSPAGAVGVAGAAFGCEYAWLSMDGEVEDTLEILIVEVGMAFMDPGDACAVAWQQTQEHPTLIAHHRGERFVKTLDLDLASRVHEEYFRLEKMVPPQGPSCSEEAFRQAMLNTFLGDDL